MEGPEDFQLDDTRALVSRKRRKGCGRGKKERKMGGGEHGGGMLNLASPGSWVSFPRTTHQNQNKNVYHLLPMPSPHS